MHKLPKKKIPYFTDKIMIILIQKCENKILERQVNEAFESLTLITGTKKD